MIRIIIRLKLSFLIASLSVVSENCPNFEENIHGAFRTGDKVILERAKFDILRLCYPNLISDGEVKEILNDRKREVVVFSLKKGEVQDGTPLPEQQNTQFDWEANTGIVFEDDKVRLLFKKMERLEEIPSSEGLLLRVKAKTDLKKDIYFSPTFSKPVKHIRIWEDKNFLYFLAKPDCDGLDFYVSGFELTFYCKR